MERPNGIVRPAIGGVDWGRHAQVLRLAKKRYGKVNEHNALVPRDHWLEAWEREAILRFYAEHQSEGYRRLTYMMMDADVVAASAATVYRVLAAAGCFARWNRTESAKGKGFQQPLTPHEQWHVDISYVNICGTFLLPGKRLGRLQPVHRPLGTAGIDA